MKNNINLIYVDDVLENYLSEYLSSYSFPDSNISYAEIRFDSKQSYESLLCDKTILSANIIVIDSRLFENAKAAKGKFSGEEFKVMLQEKFPFIETVVITQNDSDIDYGTIPKYKKTVGQTHNQYYNEILTPILNDKIRNIFANRNIGEKIEQNKSIEKYTVEKIISLLGGNAEYAELTKGDVDSLITIFADIKEDIEKNGL